MFPLGIYSVPQPDLPTVSEAGFNLVAGPAEADYLKTAHELGLKVLASPGASAGPLFSLKDARRVVGRFDNHPGLWAWDLVDEPDLNGVAPADVQRAHNYLKTLGARKPTALVLFQGGAASDYGNIADITMIDRYPIPWLPLANFPQHVRMARLALGKNKPLIAVIQAFDWSYYPELLPGQKNLRPPTYDELRCMTYCALARGATGIFYYCFDDGAWNMAEHPMVWASLKQIIAEVPQRLPLFRARHLWWPLLHEFPEPSAGFNAALESSVLPTLLRVDKGNATIASGDYLLTVNNTDRQLCYRVRLPPGNNDHLAVVGEGRTVTVRGDWLEDNFGPYAVHVYGPLRLLEVGKK